MSYLQDDLNKLIKYAQGLGIKVSIKEYVPGSENAGGWATDGTEIDLFRWPRQSKVQLILILLHELAHHMAWVYSGRATDKKLDDVLVKDSPLNKRERRLIYLSEKKDAEYQEQIAHEVGLRIPLWKIKAEKDADVWGYEQYYLNGKFPSQKIRRKLKTELRKKYKNGE